MSGTTMITPEALLEQRTLAKVTRRLVPFLIVCYFVSYLDRVNVGFAALTMNHDLGISASAFGLGAGIFFLSYFLFEVPSNLALARFGARRWIARIMLSWGILAGAMAFIGGETGFYAVRLLLGAAEAGFFPGVIFYLTLWFPAAYRGRVVGCFMAAVPASSVIGAPISSLLLGLDGLGGVKGWQWLFILEAIPAILLSVAVTFYLTDRPQEARWLAPEERIWLTTRLAAEQARRDTPHGSSVLRALADPKVLLLAVVYFGVVAALYGVAFWLPQIVKAFGLSNLQTGFVTAIPYLVGTVGMVWYGHSSDRSMERKFHTAAALALAALGIGVSTLLADPVLKMASLSVGAFGVFATLPVFWTLPTAFLSGASAAAGIAAINALGNLAGFAGPSAMGAIKQVTGSFTGGLLFIAGLAVVSLIVVLSLRHDAALERSPTQSDEIRRGGKQYAEK